MHSNTNGHNDKMYIHHTLVTSQCNKLTMLALYALINWLFACPAYLNWVFVGIFAASVTKLVVQMMYISTFSAFLSLCTCSILHTAHEIESA